MKPDLHSETPIQSETFFPEPPRIPRYWTESTDDSFNLVVALPGCARDQIQLELEENRLTIRANRPTPTPTNEGFRLVHQESLPGNYTLHLQLPPEIDAEAVRGAMENGLLTVSLPPSRSRSRNVPIA